jgi:FtsH-binding integral membrane protein
VIARVFTTISGDVVLRGAGFHIHHFWYGIILLAVGGWLGISYDDERIVRLAAVLYGAGGGLIGDEVGLLLTFGNYTTGITYTIVVIFLAFVSAVILFKRYSRAISTEIKGFTRSRASFYFGIILAVVSIAFLRTRNSLIAHISIVTTIVACIIIIAYMAQRIRARHQEGRVSRGKQNSVARAGLCLQVEWYRLF